MNPEWNTPPNGDFASYVERLTAQSALPRRQHQEGEHGLDVGMTPHSEIYGTGTAGSAAAAIATAAAAAQRRMSSNGDVPAGSRTSPTGAMVAKVASAVGFFALLLMWQAGVPIAVLIALLAGGLWIAFKLRGLKLPQGAAQWQKMLQDAASKQRQQREQQGRSK
ncbi:MAG: hypothetical protein JWQ73_197 [Variovorax sp.]|jgi:hypothetical protein|nr:hypothetical protein [Variovorax sp.]